MYDMVFVHLKTEDNFNQKIQKTESCWLWLGNKDKDGYGKFQISLGGSGNQKHVRAHRFAFELFNNIKLEPSQYLLHKCDVPACVNPEHLTIGSQKDNVHDSMRKKRRAIGNIHPKAKLTEIDVLNIRRDFESGFSFNFICEKFNMSHGAIYAIIKRKNWKHL